MSDNGASRDVALDVRNWPTINDALNQVDASRKTIERAAERGDIRRVKDAGGVWRYDPSDLEDFEAQPHGRPGAPSSDTLEETFKGSNSLLRQAWAHIERMAKIHNESTEKIVGRLLEDNERLGKQNAQLEKGYWEAITAREKALDDKHVRDLEVQTEQSREKRKNDMAKVFTEKAPNILDQVLGVDGQSLIKAKLVGEFLADLDPLLLESLLDSEFLSQPQKERLCKLLGRQFPKQEPASSSSSSSSEPKPSIDTEGQEQ